MAEDGTGKDVIIGVALATTWGTAATVNAANKGIKVNAGTWKLEEVPTEIPRNDYNGSPHETQGTEVGNIDLKGSFQVDLKFEGLDVLQALCFGTDTISGGGPYVHTLTTKSDMTGLFASLEYWDGVTDGLVDSFKVVEWSYEYDFSASAIVKLNVSWVGRKRTFPGTSGLTSITEPAAIDYVQCYAALATFQGAAQASSLAAIEINKLVVKFQRQYDADARARTSLSAPFIREPNAGAAMCSGDVTMPYNSTVYMTSSGMSVGTPAAIYKLVLVITKSASKIHEIGLPSIKWLNADATPTDKGGISHNLAFKGLLASSVPSGTDATSAYVTNTNSLAVAGI